MKTMPSPIAALFPIDLNQVPGRHDQGFRFGSANLKAGFWLVKYLEDVGYDGPDVSTPKPPGSKTTPESWTRTRMQAHPSHVQSSALEWDKRFRTFSPTSRDRR